MQAYAPDTKRDRLSIVYLGDPAVADDPTPPDPIPPDYEPPSERYARTMDRSALTLTGDPLVMHLRPLSVPEIVALQDVTSGGAMLSYVAYLVIGAALIETSGPHPVTERQVRAARTRDPVTGLTCIPRESALWSDLRALPPAAVLEVAMLFLRHQGKLSVAEGN